MKSHIDNLAIFGGPPAFREKLHVGRPNVGNRERLRQRIEDLLDRRWLTNQGPYVQELEGQIADMLGVKHCVAMCNGTIALEIAIRALELSGEVILPSFTFIATAHALQWQKITPIFCDIDPLTHNIDPKRVEELITPQTSAIIGVHLWGRPCDIDALTHIARQRNLRLLFDAAHAFSCSYKGRMLGTFGDAEIFSFHATKFFNTFEGGAVVSNDDDLARRVRLMHNFGFTGYDEVSDIGTNAKMSEVAAAMGLTSLESIDEFIEKNRQNYEHYRQLLAELPGLSLLTYDEREKSNYQYIVIEVDDDLTAVSRDLLQEILWAENVLARRYFYPGCHNMEPYRSYLPDACMSLPNTERLVRRVLTLPTGTAIGPSEVARICNVIRFTIGHGNEIVHRLLQHTTPQSLVPPSLGLPSK